MLDIIVRYLHGAAVPFVLSSYPTEPGETAAAHPRTEGAALVDTQLVLVDGRLALACFPHGQRVDLGAVGAELGGLAVETTTDALPDEFRHVRGSIPPLGQLFGVPLIIDERLTACRVIVFRAMDGDDYFDVPYDAFARLESPRPASFASAGELRAGQPGARVPRGRPSAD